MNHEADLMITALSRLYSKLYGAEPEALTALPGAGSDRKYFRLTTKNTSVIGACSPDAVEYQAFLSLSDHFRKKGLPVPDVIARDEKNKVYLIEDLGDVTLLSWIEKCRNESGFDARQEALYKQVINDLISFQLNGDSGLDYSRLPVPMFDSCSMRWDLNYFKYYFLKPAGIIFNEAALEKDFDKLVGFLAGDELRFFMYRDFQARNIMLHNNGLYYIDFQGGRKGPPHYDLVSLLFQAKAAIPELLKERLIDFYISSLKERVNFDPGLFRQRLKSFVLLRLLQVMGAYGFRGWFERKPHFLESIPLLQPNLDWLLTQGVFEKGLDELNSIVITIKEKMESKTFIPEHKLTVNINSFSYRRGIPYDASGHGGGFVFDCRLLPNPGRLEEFRLLSGKDKPVIDYLDNEPMVHTFIESAKKIVEQSIDRYLQAGYDHLQVNFGCTGGQHRSVYCAEALASKLQSINKIAVLLKHRELPNS